VRRGALAGSVAAASPSPAGTPDDGSSLCIDDNLAHVLIDDAITRTTPLTLTRPGATGCAPPRSPANHPPSTADPPAHSGGMSARGVTQIISQRVPIGLRTPDGSSPSTSTTPCCASTTNTATR